MNNLPILITGADRSGSSIVAKLLSLCGAFAGQINVMYENVEIKAQHSLLIGKNSDGCYMVNLDLMKLPTCLDWSTNVVSILQSQGLKEQVPFLYKDSGISQTWPLWDNSFPEAKWIIVRRKTPDIINSCVHTGFMKRFKNKQNLHKIGVLQEEQGWLWWIHQYEKRFIEIIQSGADYKEVWPERMADGDYEQMRDIVFWLGLEWNKEVIKIINPLFKNRK